MSRCLKSPPKHRTSNTGKGNPSDYKHGMKGCVWKKIIQNGIHIGRCCERCGKKHFKPFKKVK